MSFDFSKRLQKEIGKGYYYCIWEKTLGSDQGRLLRKEIMVASEIETASIDEKRPQF